MRDRKRIRKRDWIDELRSETDLENRALKYRVEQCENLIRCIQEICHDCQKQNLRCPNNHRCQPDP